MTDIVKRLREVCVCNYPETTCMVESECRDAFDAAAEITRLRAENKRLRAENKTLVVENDAIAASARAVTTHYERLRSALESVLDSGLLVGPTVMHDKIRGQARAALALLQYQANEVCMGGDNE